MRARIPMAITACLVLALALVPWAAADRVYHSQHIALKPVGGAPLKKGFVENIHANGPNIYSHEIYKLNGAAPNASYEVHLLAYPFDTTCSVAPTDFGFKSLETNGVGNGRADRFFKVSDVPPTIRNATHGIRWVVTLNGVPVYETGCNSVTLD
jgi:hypothetical protein